MSHSCTGSAMGHEVIVKGRKKKENKKLLLDLKEKSS
jgi:hypothetical protein